MTDLRLDIEILNTEKRETSSKKKTLAFSILTSLWALLLFSKPFNENSIYDRLGIWKGFPIILFALLLISSGYVLMYVFFKVPSKGKILLDTDEIVIRQNKTKEKISLNDLKSVKFQFNNKGEEIEVYAEIISDKIKLSNEVNIAFASERKILIKLVELWKDKGVNATIVTN